MLCPNNLVFAGTRQTRSRKVRQFQARVRGMVSCSHSFAFLDTFDRYEWFVPVANFTDENGTYLGSRRFLTDEQIQQRQALVKSSSALSVPSTAESKRSSVGNH